MSITVEDGTIVTGANSYVTTSELSVFAAARNVTLSGDYTTEQLLILAMDYIETLLYKGFKLRQEQPLQWPRVDVFIDGYYNNANTIPEQLKNGQMQTALSIDAGLGPQATVVRKTVREKVGELEVEYSAGANAAQYDPKIIAFLAKLLAGGGAGANTNAGKG